jgi:hypothetical protein
MRPHSRVMMMIKLAMVLALGALIATPAAADDGKLRMPSDEAAQAAQRCAKQGSSYIVQTTCMQTAKEEYANAHQSYQNSSVPYNLARKASKTEARAAQKDASSVDLCPPPHRMTELDGCR